MTVILRPATTEDSRDLWLWRNDETTRRNSRTTDFIPWERHDAWFNAMLTNCGSEILIALEQQTRVGMIRFDRIEPGQIGPPSFRVSILVAPASRGRGFGRSILHVGCDYLRLAHPRAAVLATVRLDNLASRCIFESNGFHRDASRDDSGFYFYLKHIDPEPSITAEMAKKRDDRSTP
jgi:RimJ/RimL family protein N-acetyltransferase